MLTFLTYMGLLATGVVAAAIIYVTLLKIELI